MATILDVIQNAASEVGVSFTITSVVGNSNATVKQLLALFNSEGKKLRRKYLWPELSRTHMFPTVATKPTYDLPIDFDTQVYDTYWDRTNHWRLYGPMTMHEAQSRSSGISVTSPRRRFRIRGGGANQTGRLEIFDTPDTDNNIYVQDFQSKNWLAPATVWTDGGAIAGSDYNRNNRTGAVYIATANGTAGGSTSINVSTSSAATDITDVTTFVQVKNTGGNTVYYKKGSSTVTAATTDTAITAGDTAYVERDYTETYIAFITASGASTVTIQGEPVHSGMNEARRDGVTDGVLWTPALYEEAKVDTDLVLLDAELLTLGLIWRFLRGQNMEYKHYYIEYNAEVARRVGAISGATAVTVGRQKGTRFLSTCNLPDTGYGE